MPPQHPPGRVVAHGHPGQRRRRGADADAASVLAGRVPLDEASVHGRCRIVETNPGLAADCPVLLWTLTLLRVKVAIHAPILPGGWRRCGQCRVREVTTPPSSIATPPPKTALLSSTLLALIVAVLVM